MLSRYEGDTVTAYTASKQFTYRLRKEKKPTKPF
jgi:hypothetical protein